MIQHILLPEKIGSYSLFGKRVVGVEITKTHVYATVVYFKGSAIVIEQSLEAPIEQHNGDSAVVRTGAALKKIFALAGKYHEIRFAVSSTQIIFKTMQLPFDEIDKIKKVIDFEVEPLLPFSITDAVIDFIITKANPAQHSCEVLIAAVQKPYIAQQLELFTQIGAAPDVISIDLFELYGLYTQIGHEHKGNAALIEICNDSTKMIFISDGQLRFIRTLPINLDFTKKTTDERSSTERSPFERSPFERSPFAQPSAAQPSVAQPSTDQPGVEVTEQPEAPSEPFANAKTFADSLLFTLQSFTTQAHLGTEPPTIYLLGSGATVPGLLPWLQHTLNMPVALFNPTRITENPHITLKAGSQIPVANTISMAVAISSPTTEHLNIRQKEFAPNTERLLLKQLICGLLLLLSIFAALMTHSFLQKRALHKELTASKAETAALLSQWFPTIDKGAIDDMLEEAETETKKDERTWFAFARSANTSLLNLLLELTKINREGPGLVVEKIIIDQERGLMTLKAHVKDHEALVRLENELKQSKLFSYVQPQNDINFSMELRFAGEREGES